MIAPLVVGSEEAVALHALMSGEPAAVLADRDRAVIHACRVVHRLLEQEPDAFVVFLTGSGKGDAFNLAREVADVFDQLGAKVALSLLDHSGPFRHPRRRGAARVSICDASLQSGDAKLADLLVVDERAARWVTWSRGSRQLLFTFTPTPADQASWLGAQQWANDPPWGDEPIDVILAAGTP